MPDLVLGHIESALMPIGEALAADGYQLSVSIRSDRVGLEVTAGADACADCLVPKHLFAAMAANALAEHGLGVAAGSLDIIYPPDQH